MLMRYISGNSHQAKCGEPQNVKMLNVYSLLTPLVSGDPATNDFDM